jgi:hypothetical protein
MKRKRKGRPQGKNEGGKGKKKTQREEETKEMMTAR